MTKSLLDQLAYNETFRCVQCGYCLPTCPTYTTMKKETHSPRGRINLVKMAAEGRISLEQLKKPIELCLGCRACETVCPTNVPYGTILESAKYVLATNEKQYRSKSINWMKDTLLNKTITNRSRLSLIGQSLRIYEKSKIKNFVHKSKLINMFPEQIRAFDKIFPEIASKKALQTASVYNTKKTKQPYKIAFFKGCIMDTVFQDINEKSVKLLQLAGFDVTIVDKQTCCGAIQSHSGELERAKQLAKENINAFENGDFDFIVNSIGGCGAMLVEYDQLLEKDKEWRERASVFAKKVKDISFVLSLVDLPFQKEIPKTVTYQPSCHMVNVQKNIEPPLRLLKAVPGIILRQQENASSCCGSAGTYNLVHYDESMEILDQKMNSVVKTNAEIIVTTNPGCHLQMKLGVERVNQSNEVKVVHLVELLAEACGIE